MRISLMQISVKYIFYKTGIIKCMLNCQLFLYLIKYDKCHTERRLYLHFDLWSARSNGLRSFQLISQLRQKTQWAKQPRMGTETTLQAKGLPGASKTPQ